jgi:hemerythrin-like metal-binding protein
MTYFEWDSSLRTGDVDIDDQHRSLFALANALQEAVATRNEDPDVVTDAVYRLTDYVVQHFHDEEALMERYRYPGTNSHRGLHEYLTSETMRMAMRYFNDEDLLPDTLAPFLADWLTGHIRQEDVRLVEYVRTRGSD